MHAGVFSLWSAAPLRTRTKRLHGTTLTPAFERSRTLEARLLLSENASVVTAGRETPLVVRSASLVGVDRVVSETRFRGNPGGLVPNGTTEIRITGSRGGLANAATCLAHEGEALAEAGLATASDAGGLRREGRSQPLQVMSACSA